MIIVARVSLALRLATGLAAAGLSAGGEAQDPIVMIQLCLENESGLTAFKETLQSIALEEGMQFADSSAKVMRDLQAVRAAAQNMHADGGLIFIDLEGGRRLRATNLGLNLYEVTVTFRDPNTDAANEFAADVVARLERVWKLKIIPRGATAYPDPNCQP